MTSIIEIKAIGNIPLSKECLPICRRHPLWPPPPGQTGSEVRGATLPTAYLLNKNNKKPARLEVTIDIPDVKPGIYTLKGFSTGDQNFLLFEGKTKITSMHKKGKKIKFKAYDQIDQSYFRRFEGTIKWQIIRREANSVETTYDLEEQTYVELFWLHGFNCRLFRQGIPVEILRHAAYALRITGYANTPATVWGAGTKKVGSPLTDPVITAIANVCFFRNTPRYDCDSGSYHLIICKDPDHITFKLGKYLNSIKDSNALCNCYDMAGVIQLHLKAVGIEDVKFCYMYPFGYIRLTKLIGRGLCNSPGYDIYNPGYDLVVDENCDIREKFDSHAFCCLPGIATQGGKECNKDNYCIDCRVLDACIGPHCGNENIRDYLANTLDDECPKNKCPIPSAVKIYDGIKEIDFIPDIKGEPKLPHIKAFKKEIGYSNQKYINSMAKFVVNTFNPEFVSSILRAAGFSGWSIVFEGIIPGTNEVLKTWKLGKYGASIQIDAYVCSDTSPSRASRAAKFRFLALGSGSSLTKLPYKKGPSDLGKYSAVCERENHCQYLWTDKNVTFHVIGQNIPSSELEKLCIQLASNFIERSKKIETDTKIERALPLLPDNKEPIKIEVMENATLETKSSGDVFMDFVFEEGDGIQLIKKQDKKLTFIGLRKSKNIITVAVVDKNTLLTNSKQITIEVEG